MLLLKVELQNRKPMMVRLVTDFYKIILDIHLGCRRNQRTYQQGQKSVLLNQI